MPSPLLSLSPSQRSPQQMLQSETEEERRLRILLEQLMRSGSGSGDGFSPQTQTEFSGDGFSGRGPTHYPMRDKDPMEYARQLEGAGGGYKEMIERRPGGQQHLEVAKGLKRNAIQERAAQQDGRFFTKEALSTPNGIQQALEQFAAKTPEELTAMAGQIQTPEEKASDNMLQGRRDLAGRNKQALEGRLPGYQPEALPPEQQSRIARTMMGDARGGMVDETSPLNSRAGILQAALAQDRSAELQKQQQFAEMGKKQRDIMSTRSTDAEGNLNAPVESSTSNTRRSLANRGKVTTIAEKMAGIEDDPSTPMDESIRYRAVWDGIDPEELRKKRSQAVAARRKERSEEQAATRSAFQEKKAQAAAQQQQLNILQQMMQLDNATGGQAHATASWLQRMSGQKPPENLGPDQSNNFKGELALALIGSEDPRAKEMGFNLIQGMMNPGQPGQAGGLPMGGNQQQTPEQKKTEADKINAQETDNVRRAAGIIKSFKDGVYTKEEAMSRAEATGDSEIIRMTKKQIEAFEEKQRKIALPNVHEETYVPMM